MAQTENQPNGPSDEVRDPRFLAAPVDGGAQDADESDTDQGDEVDDQDGDDAAQ